MARPVNLTDLARSDLRAIAEYIAQDNPGAAERFANKLLDDALSLAHAPQRGLAVRRKPGVRRLVRGAHLIYYRLESDSGIVRILRFWHGARHPETPRFDWTQVSAPAFMLYFRLFYLSPSLRRPILA